MTRTLYGIGTGPGDPKLLTVQAVESIQKANVIFAPNNRGKNMALDSASPYIRNQKVVLLDFPMGETTEETYRQAMKTIDGELKEGEIGAFLNIGDSTIYSTFMNMVRTYCPSDLSWHLIPGIPSFIGAGNCISENLVVKGERFLLCEEVDAQILHHVDTVAILKTFKNLDKTLDLLEENGFSYTYITKATLPEERVLTSREEILKEKNYISLLLARKSR